jgi:phospholipase/lecithinase/hemolysin
MRFVAVAVTLTALVLVAPAPAGPIPVVVVGDDLSDPYFHHQGSLNPETGLPYWGANQDRNWTEQLTASRGGQVSFYNYAFAGATTADLLRDPEKGDPKERRSATDKAALRVQNNRVGRGVVIAGSSDVLAYLNGELGSDPAAFLTDLAGNLNAILTEIESAGPIALAVGNIPDLTVTPSMQALLGGVPGALEDVAALIQAANQQIAALAQAHGAALVDLYGLSRLAASGLTMAGTTVPQEKVFAPDGFHPGTIPQGLLANTVLAAFGGDLGALALSDQEILASAGVQPVDAGPTFTDVSGNVQKTPEPASVVLLSLAGAFGFRCRRRWK